MYKLNSNISKLSDYPFERLRLLLEKIMPKDISKITDLSIGQPYHKVPSFIKTTILKESNKWNLYPPILGIKDLRDAYKNWLKRRFNLKELFFEEDIVPLSGTREGLFSIALTLNINNIVVPNPFYQAYLGATVFQKSAIKFLGKPNENNPFYDLAELEKNLQEKDSLIYFCSPSNPQGKIASFDYIKKLIKLIRKYRAVLIIDECYSDIYYQEIPQGAIKVCEELGKGLKNILIFHSLSKRSNVAGMRSGFVVGDKNIINLFKKIRSYGAPSMPLPIQLASVRLWNDDEHVYKNINKYKKKINYANSILSKYRLYEKPEAGFYLWINVKNGESFTKELFKKYYIKVMPGEYLAKGNKKNPGKEYVRVALVENYVTSKFAIDKIAEFLKC